MEVFMEAVVDKTSQIAKDFIAAHQKEAKEKEAAAEAAKAKGDEKAEPKGAAKEDKQKTEAVHFAAGAFYPISLQPSETWEIIGNIYENKELQKYSYDYDDGL